MVRVNTEKCGSNKWYMVLDLNLATDDLEFTRCWYLRSGQHLKVWVLMEGPKGLAMKGSSVIKKRKKNL